MKCLKKIFGLICLVTLISSSFISCASIKITREKGEVIKVEQKGLGKFIVDKDGGVIGELAPNWYPKDVVNIYKE